MKIVNQRVGQKKMWSSDIIEECSLYDLRRSSHDHEESKFNTVPFRSKTPFGGIRLSQYETNIDILTPETTVVDGNKFESHSFRRHLVRSLRMPVIFAALGGIVVPTSYQKRIRAGSSIYERILASRHVPMTIFYSLLHLANLARVLYDIVDEYMVGTLDWQGVVVRLDLLLYSVFAASMFVSENLALRKHFPKLERSIEAYVVRYNPNPPPCFVVFTAIAFCGLLVAVACCVAMAIGSKLTYMLYPLNVADRSGERHWMPLFVVAYFLLWGPFFSVFLLYTTMVELFKAEFKAICAMMKNILTDKGDNLEVDLTTCRDRHLVLCRSVDDLGRLMSRYLAMFIACVLVQMTIGVLSKRLEVEKSWSVELAHAGAYIFLVVWLACIVWGWGSLNSEIHYLADVVEEAEWDGIPTNVILKMNLLLTHLRHRDHGVTMYDAFTIKRKLKFWS